VLENTLGGTVVWSRNAAGSYYATLTNAFTTGFTVFPVISMRGAPASDAGWQNISDDVSEIQSADDGTIANWLVEIRVYTP
jgi:hypothetical protein